MDTYSFLQHYWWLVVSLLGALLVFLLFVQGGNSLLFILGRDEHQRRLLVNSTGRKWEFTFTMLVVFGGAFFASFPLFYSTSFGGAYWLWMIILFSFVLQAVSYEFQGRRGNLLGRRAYQVFLVINGVLAPFLLGAAVATFFTGSQFIICRDNIASISAPAISIWANGWHGLDALANVWVVVFGLAVLFLAQVLGLLYQLSNVSHAELNARMRRLLLPVSALFLVFFLLFVVRTLLAPGYEADAVTGAISIRPYKYFHSLVQMPVVALLFVAGVAGVLYGIIRTLLRPEWRRGIWPVGAGTVLTVLSLFLLAGYNGATYYPSTADLQSSLTISNSSSSLFTLKVMAWVSILVPAVAAYMVYAWRQIDSRPITSEELDSEEGHAY
jgi:cytochrome d ubiquinol oxidase subunit II